MTADCPSGTALVHAPPCYQHVGQRRGRRRGRPWTLTAARLIERARRGERAAGPDAWIVQVGRILRGQRLQSGRDAIRRQRARFDVESARQYNLAGGLPASRRVAAVARLMPMTFAAPLQVCVAGSKTSPESRVVATISPLPQVALFASTPPNAATCPESAPVTTAGSIATSANCSRGELIDPVVAAKVCVVGSKMNERFDACPSDRIRSPPATSTLPLSFGMSTAA